MSDPLKSTRLPLRFGSGFEAFRRLVLDETALQEKLADIIDRERFIGRVVELGLEHGFQFQPADVEAALRAARRTWTESRTP